MTYRITVLMGIYNCAETLKDALDSLIFQEYKNFKVVLCDDCSSDTTLQIAEDYARRYDNIYVIRNEKNLKLPATLNHCLQYADTEYVARMDGDDISMPERFARQIQFLDEHPEYALVSCQMIYFDESGDWGKSSSLPEPSRETFLKGTPHAHAPCMIRTAVLKEVGGYTVSPLTQRGQDYHLWYKIYKAGYRGFNLQEPLYKMRDDKNAMSRRTFMSRIREFRLKRLILKGLGFRFSWAYALPALIKAFIPGFLMERIRKKRMKLS